MFEKVACFGDVRTWEQHQWGSARASGKQAKARENEGNREQGKKGVKHCLLFQEGGHVQTQTNPYNHARHCPFRPTPILIPFPVLRPGLTSIANNGRQGSEELVPCFIEQFQRPEESSYITLPPIPELITKLTSFSIELWFKTTARQHTMSLFKIIDKKNFQTQVLPLPSCKYPRILWLLLGLGIPLLRGRNRL